MLPPRSRSSRNPINLNLLPNLPKQQSHSFVRKDGLPSRLCSENSKFNPSCHTTPKFHRAEGRLRLFLSRRRMNRGGGDSALSTHLNDPAWGKEASSFESHERRGTAETVSQPFEIQGTFDGDNSFYPQIYRTKPEPLDTSCEETLSGQSLRNYAGSYPKTYHE